MSDIRFNNWLHQSGTGGVYQDSSGRVGIGTSIPTSALDVQSGSIKIGSNTLSSSGVSTFTNLVVSAGSTSAPSISPSGDSNTGIFFPSADTVAFAEGGTEVLRVNSSGYVGVGTDNPDKKLVVKGTGGNFVSEFSNTNNASNNNGVYISVQNTASATQVLNVSSGGNSSLIVQGDGNLKLPTAGTKVLNSSGNPILNQTGSILQVAQVVKTDAFSTDSDSMIDVPGLSVSITPSSANNKILVIADIHAGTNYYVGFINVVRNSTTLLLGDAAGSRPRSTIVVVEDPTMGGTHGWSDNFNRMILDSPATTSSVTYKIQASGRIDNENNGAIFINRTAPDRNTAGYDVRMASSITVMEVSG